MGKTMFSENIADALKVKAMAYEAALFYKDG